MADNPVSSPLQEPTPGAPTPPPVSPPVDGVQAVPPGSPAPAPGTLSPPAPGNDQPASAEPPHRSTAEMLEHLAARAAFFVVLVFAFLLVILVTQLLGIRSMVPRLGLAGLVAVASAYYVWSLMPKHAVKLPTPAAQPTDVVREIIETVVFVVVLVLLLKSFAAEAFVIPTGSMAQTLLGYQKFVTCPQCGLDFPVNCSSEVDPSDGPPSWVSGCTCPNCRQHIEFSPPPELQERMGARVADAGAVLSPDPDWSSGDRVLVAKFVYDLLNRNPDRMDVVVFKFPGDDKFPDNSGPVKRQVPMNYIKRLIGLPGETIAIYKGKLYALNPDKGLSYDDYDQARNDPNKLALLWQKDHMHPGDPRARDLFDKPDSPFQIIRKKPEQILAMMRIVYDNDHPARDLTGPEYQRWVAPEGGWADHDPNGFVSLGGNEDRESWLRYRHVLRDSHGKAQLITDFMGYNTWETGRAGHRTPEENWASDLILECEAQVERPEGELTMELSKGSDRFQAVFDLGSGICTLYRLRDGQEREKLEQADARVKGKGTYRLRLANTDDKLTVWVDGRLPFGPEGVSYKGDRGVIPTQKNDLERPASIGVKGARVAVRKLRLLRDTYYTTALGGGPSNADIPGFDPANEGTWSKLSEARPATFYVQPDHFLCLGDNSPESSDGRSWGTVPRRLLLGRALLVYYPFFPFSKINRAGRIR